MFLVVKSPFSYGFPIVYQHFPMEIHHFSPFSYGFPMVFQRARGPMTFTDALGTVTPSSSESVSTSDTSRADFAGAVW